MARARCRAVRTPPRLTMTLKPLTTMALVRRPAASRPPLLQVVAWTRSRRRTMRRRRLTRQRRALTLCSAAPTPPLTIFWRPRTATARLPTATILCEAAPCPLQPTSTRWPMHLALARLPFSDAPRRARPTSLRRPTSTTAAASLRPFWAAPTSSPPTTTRAPPSRPAARIPSLAARTRRRAPTPPTRRCTRQAPARMRCPAACYPPRRISWRRLLSMTARAA